MNITELARKLKVPTSELREKLPELGFDIGLKAIKIDDKVAEKAVKAWKEYMIRERHRRAAEKREETEKTEEKREAGPIAIPSRISVRDFSGKLGLPITKVIAELLKNGVVANINQEIDYETAAIIAGELGFEAKKKSEDQETSELDESQNELRELLKENDGSALQHRPPIITIMGHVDHGKTTLLDAIRQTNVVGSESGGITQHIGAYQIEKKGRLITFIDTPGHEAFKAMRIRGGKVADIAILVVAADDSLQPQTLESIKIIQQEKIPFVVAINKIDKAGADAEKVKKDLSQLNLLPEDWGGKTICVPISAKNKEGLDDLLDMILLVADMDKDKLLADPAREAVGTIIESHVDKGEGSVIVGLIHTGTLRLGDLVTVGKICGKVKAIKDFRNKPLSEAGPSVPAKILGLKGTAEVGEILQATSDKKSFRKKSKQSKSSRQKTTFAGQSAEAEGKTEILNVVLRADVLGSLETVCESLEQMEHPEVKISIVKKGLGDISETDIMRAESAKALVVGFNVNASPSAAGMAKEKNIEIQTFEVIYKLLDLAKERLSKLLKPEIIRIDLGEAKVLAIFRTAANFAIAGGIVTIGKAAKGSLVEIIHQGNETYRGMMTQLQSNKQDAEEVREGSECGMKIEGRLQIAEGDMLKFYREEEKERSL